MTQPHLHICVVCSGNICRSPMAELILTESLRGAGLEQHVRVSSAGVGSWHIGHPIDPRALSTLHEHGYDGEHVAAQLDTQHLEADLLLAADAGHLRALRDKAPDASRVCLLRDFDPDAPAGAEIPDPYYGGTAGFDDALGMIERATPGIVDWVRERV